MRRLLTSILVSTLVLVAGFGCRNEDEQALPSTQIDPVATEVVAATPTTVATQATPPTQTATVRVWTQEELKKNTVVFKQDSGFAVGKAYEGQGFVIEYDGGSIAYYVRVQAVSLAEYRNLKKQAEAAFLTAGAKDLCALFLYFAVPKELRNHTDRSDLFATGCPSLF